MKAESRYLTCLQISVIFFILFLIFLPKNSFAENPTATCYTCVVGQINTGLQRHQSLDSVLNTNYASTYKNSCDTCSMSDITDLLSTFSTIKQSGPAQADAASCNQFLNKVENNQGTLSAAMNHSQLQPDSITIQKIYDDLRQLGAISGNFCTTQMIADGQANWTQGQQETADCATCQANCGQPGHKSCSDCAKIVGCSAPDTLSLNPFGTFNTMDGGFGSGNNINIGNFITGIVGTGGAIIGGLAVLKIIFGGVMYATAAGNPQRISDAKSHILYALLGIALIAGANIILMLFGASPIQ